MHLRRVSSIAKGKTYQYAQLVESYRREDGKPAVRVVKHLGKLSDDVFEAFRAALDVGRSGDAFVTRSEVARLLSGSTVANLRYLDLAVLIDCWSQWGIGTLLDESVGAQETKVSLAEVVLALTLQRCCAPGSKLEATRWVPTTALPLVRGFDIETFHCSRIHRVLNSLFDVTEALQQSLCEKYVRADGQHAVLFMDVTDTYFEGIGCPMAEQTRTKTEMPHKRCLSIVLLANEHGFPMRWKVVGGKTKDWDAMGGMLADIGKVEWLEKTPVVFDRAMGNQKTVAALKAAGALRFLTAAHITAIDSYTRGIPFTAVSDTELQGTDESYEQDIERVAQAAREAMFEEIHSGLFAIELGVAVPVAEQEKKADDASLRKRRGRHVQAAKHLQQAYLCRNKMAADKTIRVKDLAAELGITPTHLTNQLSLLHLSPLVQERILEWGDRFPFGEKDLRSLLDLPSEEQLSALDEKLAEHIGASSSISKNKKRADKEDNDDDNARIGPLRMVAYFNPQLFVDIRRRTALHCEKLQQHVETFNKDLAEAKRSRDYNATYRRFAHEVERLGYLDLFCIELVPISIKSGTGLTISSFQGSITRNEEAWRRRRRYDGFVLLLGHPDLPHTARQLVNFYRIKDTVEKDFQTIKSCIKLRPIYSYTDPKVQAHVTICMLALLLQRTLERRLKTAGLHLTAPACIEVLRTCHLNQRRSENEPLYDITQLNSAQREILVALGLEQLADDEHLRAQISPHSPAHLPPSTRKRARPSPQ
jgi:transposase